MGFKRKLKRSYFSMFLIPSLIIVLIAACVLVIVSERYEQQLENISDEAILTAAVQSVIKDFKEVDDRRDEQTALLCLQKNIRRSGGPSRRRMRFMMV